MSKRPVVLTILDGWGYSPITEGNAVYLANSPAFDMLHATYPHTLIHTSGHYVGLPDGQMGNSEVGHLNIGAGRILRMDVTRIDHMIETGEFFSDPALKKLMNHARGRRLHLMGLVSDGGVHSYSKHLFALLEMAKREALTDVAIHAFTDGRDTPPNSGLGFIEELLAKIKELGVGRLATVTGRYYSMDRDKRWERVEKAFRAIVEGAGIRTKDPIAAMRQSYEKGVTDEFIEPIVVIGDDGEPVGPMRDEDACLFFNFRADRGRELTVALMDPNLDGIPRNLMPRGLHYSTMTLYDRSFAALGVEHVLPVETPDNILGQVLDRGGLTNLRVAETEKYPHVTFFFNGGIEKPFHGEEREMVASPKVATYDLKPEMSAQGVCDVVTKAIRRGGLDVIVVNFANPDMVGHTGSLPAAIKACETADACLTEIHAALKEKGGQWIITADHGNAETMIDPVTGGPHTYHTTNPVPLIVVSEEPKPLRAGCSLRDISPTILGMLGLPKPAQMTGEDMQIR